MTADWTLELLVIVIAAILLVLAVDTDRTIDRLEVRVDSIVMAHEQETEAADRDAVVVRAALEFGVPAHLALAVSHTENWGGDSVAVSRKGAVGIMQVMPRAHVSTTVALCGAPERLVELECNARVGVYILRSYRNQYGDWPTALRRYVGVVRNHSVGNAYVQAVSEKLGGGHNLW
jgi:soluble lytic murein transglycosylase-like protein